jgi:uncharacterized membrane protein
MRASAPRARSRSLRARAFAFALALALVVARASSIAEAIEAKCSACRAVGKSLAKALREDAESADGKVVDMRGRLDSRGRRYGKRISYKVSELRFVELLDGVCDKPSEVGKYQLHEETNRWRIPPNPVKKIRHARGKQMKTEILGYCHRVIEESEEALQAAVLEERLDAESNVEEFLCRNVSKACDESVDFSEEEPKDNDFYDDEEKESKRVEPPKKKERRSKAKKAAKQEL